MAHSDRWDLVFRLFGELEAAPSRLVSRVLGLGLEERSAMGKIPDAERLHEVEATAFPVGISVPDAQDEAGRHPLAARSRAGSPAVQLFRLPRTHPRHPSAGIFPGELI